MGDSDTERLLEAIRHYQKGLERYGPAGNTEKMLHAIAKLSRLPIKMTHLEQTGVGRTVNQMKKIGGEVGDAARSLVDHWKEMVQTEQNESEDEGNPADDSLEGPASPDHNESDHNDYANDSDHLEISSPKNSGSRKGSLSPESDKKTSKKRRRSESDSDHFSNDHKSHDNGKHRSSKHRKSSESQEESLNDESESERNSESDSDSDRHRSKKSVNKEHQKNSKKYKRDSSGSSEDNRSRRRDSSKSGKDKNGHSSKEYKKEKERVKSSHSSSDEKHKKSNENDKKHSSSSEKHQKHSKSESNSSKSKDSSTKSKSGRDKDKTREKDKQNEHRDKRKEKASSSKDRDSRKEKEKPDSSSKKQENNKVQKEKDNSDRESKKNKDKDSRRDKDESSSTKKSEKNSKDKEKSDKPKESSSKDKEKSKSIPTKPKKSSLGIHIDSESGTSFADVLGMLEPPRKVKKKVIQPKAEIDSEGGASFADALGMCEPSSVKSSSRKNRTTRESSSSGTKDVEEKSVPNLLKESKLEPLDLNVDVLLPPPNYKPLGAPIEHSNRMVLNGEDMLNRVITNKNQRTKVYSGNKTYTKVPSLFDICVRFLQDNLDALEFTGGVPYYILKPILEKANPDQLYMLEHHNPYLIDDTDELWQLHCQKDFKNKKREELESWREMYMRCLDEREMKLKALTANIKQSQDKSLPVRTTKLASVDDFVKPPRNVLRKQVKNGTAHGDRTPLPVKKRELATSGEAGKISVPNPVHRNAERSSTSHQKPKKAPLMAKLLSSMKGSKFPFGRR